MEVAAGHDRWPALVIGGGPSGAAAAITLARSGVATRLVERSLGPHDTVCGAFLGADALARLRLLGIDPAALGAQPVTRLRMISGARVIETDLPFAAAGLSRRVLDEALIGAADAAGVRVTRGCGARSACLESRSVRLQDGQTLAGDALFLATGKHELRNASRARSARNPPAIGLRAALPSSGARTRALSGYIELHLFDEGYAGILLQEDGTANLCMSVAPSRLARADDPQGLLTELMARAPLLRERIGSDRSARFIAVAGVPYGWRAGETVPGVFRLGDQAAVIASLAGDGIAMAVASGQDAAAACIAGGSDAAQAWQRAWSGKCRRPIALAETLRRTAEAPAWRGVGWLILQLFPGLAARAASLTRIDR